MSMLIGVPREVFPGEKRVATVPEVVPKLAKLGFSVIVQSGAGEEANKAEDKDNPSTTKLGTVLRDAKREPEKERGDEEREGGIAGEQRKKTKF